MVEGRLYVAAWETGLENVQSDIYRLISLATEVTTLIHNTPIYWLLLEFGRLNVFLHFYTVTGVSMFSNTEYHYKHFTCLSTGYRQDDPY